jgi:hypothetical protein
MRRLHQCVIRQSLPTAARSTEHIGPARRASANLPAPASYSPAQSSPACGPSSWASRFAPLNAVLLVASCRTGERRQDKGDTRTGLRQSLSASRAVSAASKLGELRCEPDGKSRATLLRVVHGRVSVANGLKAQGERERCDPAKSVFLEILQEANRSFPDGYHIANTCRFHVGRRSSRGGRCLPTARHVHSIERHSPIDASMVRAPHVSARSRPSDVRVRMRSRSTSVWPRKLPPKNTRCSFEGTTPIR